MTSNALILRSSLVVLSAALSVSAQSVNRRRGRRLAVGAIVGIVIGGVVLTLLLCIGCLCCMRGRRRRAGFTPASGGIGKPMGPNFTGGPVSAEGGYAAGPGPHGPFHHEKPVGAPVGGHHFQPPAGAPPPMAANGAANNGFVGGFAQPAPAHTREHRI